MAHAWVFFNSTPGNANVHPGVRTADLAGNKEHVCLNILDIAMEQELASGVQLVKDLGFGILRKSLCCRVNWH